MAAGATIEFDPASLRRFYKRIDPDGLIKKPMDSFYTRVGDDIAKKAKNLAPVDTGTLKDSIKVEKPRNMLGSLRGVAVVVRTSYAVFVHEGTKPHFPPVNALRGWAERRGISPYAVAAGIAEKGTRAQPFLRDATEQAARALPIELRVAVTDIETRWRV